MRSLVCLCFVKPAYALPDVRALSGLPRAAGSAALCAFCCARLGGTQCVSEATATVRRPGFEPRAHRYTGFASLCQTLIQANSRHKKMVAARGVQLAEPSRLILSPSRAGSYPTRCLLVRFSHIQHREHRRCCARRAMRAK